MTVRGGFKYILKRLKELLVKTSDTRLVPEDHINQSVTCRGTDMKKSAAELNKSRTDYSTPSIHYLPSEEYKKIKFLKCTSATFLVTLLMIVAFVVLPILYLLHCFNFLNSQWPPNEFNPLKVDNNHSYSKETSWVHPNSNLANEISNNFVTGTQEINKNYVNHTKDIMLHSNASTIGNLLPQQCSNILDAFKFDCYPENGAIESACTKRGCCWSPKLVNHTSFGKSPLDVPYCYYPSNYGGYKFINVSETRYGSTAFLHRSFSSPYPNDIHILKIDVMYETEQQLHIKIYDPIHSRFEPPYPEVPVIERAVPKRDYKIVLDTMKTGFKVLRKSNNETIFNAQDVGGFIFADQFLQLSALIPSNNIYGLGEHRSTLLLSTKWQRFTMFNSDHWPVENVNLYGSHPFYLVMEKSGKSHGVFLLNSNALEVLLQPAPAITFRAIGGIIDLYFFMGPSPERVVQQYTDVVGKPFMPPYWGLGFHLCRYGYKTLNHTMDVWKRTLKAGIPLDVQWNDLDYMKRSNDFTYDKVNFQGLPEFVKELHKLGMHYIPLIDAGVSAGEVPNTYPPYDDGLKMGIFVKNSSGQPFVGKVWNAVSTVWPDFTHPHTVDYWMKQLKRMHEEFQFDGAWIDMNEPSNFLSGSIHGCPNNSLDHPPYVPNVSGGQLFYRTLCMSCSQYAGKHYDLHNLYGFTEAIITAFSLAELRGKRPFVISRSTFPGHGHYAGHWTGDIHSTWYDMGKTISEVLSFNMFGIPLVGADICGFNGNTTAALCQRWMQLGAFYPFSRNHNSDDSVPQDPVILGPEVVQSARKALLVRYSLLPYLYTLFWKSHVNGDTVARPLFFEFPLDIQTYSIDEQFLWGSALMIIPVLVENKTEVVAYLPRAMWYNFYTMDVVNSTGAKYTFPAPLDTIPLSVRGGNIIPMQTPNLTTTETRKNDIELLVATDGKGEATGSLYWDDGDSLNTWRDGHYNLLNFTMKDSILSSVVSRWGYDEPLILCKVIVLGVDAPVKDVYVNEATRPFSYNTNNRVLEVKNLNILLKKLFTIHWS